MPDFFSIIFASPSRVPNHYLFTASPIKTIKGIIAFQFDHSAESTVSPCCGRISCVLPSLTNCQGFSLLYHPAKVIFSDTRHRDDLSCPQFICLINTLKSDPYSTSRLPNIATFWITRINGLRIQIYYSVEHCYSFILFFRSVHYFVLHSVLFTAAPCLSSLFYRF